MCARAMQVAASGPATASLPTKLHVARVSVWLGTHPKPQTGQGKARSLVWACSTLHPTQGTPTCVAKYKVQDVEVL